MIARSIFALVIHFPFLVEAQDKIVLSSGESLLGKIENVSPSATRIHIVSTDKTEKILAGQIEYVLITHTNSKKYYYAKKVSGSTPKLMELISPGKIKTYSYDETNSVRSITSYYLEKDSSGLIFIGRQTGFIGATDDVSPREIKMKLRPLFEDNPDLLNKFIADSKNTKRSVISEYVKAYNDGWVKNNGNR